MECLRRQILKPFLDNLSGPFRLSLKSRFILSFTLLVGFLMVSVIGIVEYRQSRAILWEVRKRGIAITQNLAAVSANSLLIYNYIALKQDAEKVALAEDIAYVIILDKEGKVAAFSGRDEMQGLELTDEVSLKASGARGTLIQEVYSPDASGERVLDIAVPVFIKGSAVRWGLVRIGLSIEGMYRDIARLRLTLILMGLMAIILGVLGAIITSRKITRPLDELVMGTVAIADGDLDYRIDIHTGDELEGLARSFNQMTAQLLLNRQRLEGQLREIMALKRYNDNILESMAGGLLTINKAGEVVVISRKGKAILGWDNRVVGSDWKRPLKGNEGFRKIIRDTLQTGKVYQDVEVVFSKGGTMVILLVSVVPLVDEDGSRNGLILTFQDITGIKEMEEKVRKADRLAILGTIAASLAHELRNPLTAIKTFIQILPKRLHQKEFLDRFYVTVPRELNRMNEIIENLLDLARGPRLRFSEVDINGLIVGLAQLYGPEVERRKVTLRFYPGKDIPPLQGDPEYLNRAFSNLIVNALQAMPRGGELEIQTGIESMVDEGNRIGEATALPKAITILFRDNGIGMDPDTQKNIFNPFYSTKEKGAGLGLAITHTIIKGHNGRIDVNSTLGKGTTFIITLPLEPSPHIPVQS